MYTNTLASVNAKPFLKWPGGKSQIINKLIDCLPPELEEGFIKKYAEPFIGGGALFFYLAQKFTDIEHFYISDINEELILIYLTIQRDVENLIDILEKYEKDYYDLNPENKKSFFYELRATLNSNRKNIDFEYYSDVWLNRAATLIFLNRTCFNGLFRVNSVGKFNVPFGDNKNPKICDRDNLLLVSNLLQNTQIHCADFTASKSFIDETSFVYFDPPYRPISKTSSFTSYAKFNFGEDDQIRLAQYFSELDKKGAKILLSNSDPKNNNPDDHFFEEAYNGFNIQRIEAKRMINCVASKRGNIKEIIIMNY